MKKIWNPGWGWRLNKILIIIVKVYMSQLAKDQNNEFYQISIFKIWCPFYSFSILIMPEDEMERNLPNSFYKGSALPIISFVKDNWRKNCALSIIVPLEEENQYEWRSKEVIIYIRLDTGGKLGGGELKVEQGLED